MKNKTLAIIGCGAAAASFIRSFIQQCNEFNLKNINLLIFEPSPTLGVGVAYQEDLNNLLINRPAQTMSANLHQPDEFFRWLIETNKSFPNEDVIKERKYIYPSRKTFGYYLTELTEKSISKANHYNIVVKIIKDSVIQLYSLEKVALYILRQEIIVHFMLTIYYLPRETISQKIFTI